MKMNIVWYNEGLAKGKSMRAHWEGLSEGNKLAAAYFGFIIVLAIALFVALVTSKPEVKTKIVVEPDGEVVEVVEGEEPPPPVKKDKPSCLDKPKKKGCDMSDVKNSFFKALDAGPIDFCKNPNSYFNLVYGGIQKDQWKLGEWYLRNCPKLGYTDSVQTVKSQMAIGGYIFYTK